MSGASEKKMSGWTMVDSKGEVMTDDSRSISSESSTESFSLLQEDPTGRANESAAAEELPSEVSEELELNNNVPTIPCLDTDRYDEIPLPSDHDDIDSSLLANLPSPKLQDSVCESADDSQCMVDSSRQQSLNETVLEGANLSSDGASQNLVERYEGLGACCEELMERMSDAENQPSTNEEYKEVEDKDEVDDIPLNVDNSVPSPNFLDENSRQMRQRHNSDSDSDFVQINEGNLEELEAELAHNRNGVPDRSPSIAEGFNFLGPAGEGIRDQVPGNDNLSDRDSDIDEDVNEDTESSTEDVGDDRIESDQSEVGSVMNNNPTDVADLSAFADIGDLPLIAGNVARNYCHRPNKGLSAILNIILIVVSLLTMGISIGLIMATDLEMEEWQQAYNIQAKKASSLEWTLADLNKLMQDSKNKVSAYESVLKSFSKAENHNTGSSVFFSGLPDIVNNFESCTRKHGSLSSIDCHALVMPDIRLSLSQFKQAMKKADSAGSFDFTLDGISRKVADVMAGLAPKDEQTNSNDHQQKLQESQLSLQREQERALHWQNLYLLERRQREWERENEDLEDQRERAQWEKEDEEEDRRMREIWEREEAENDKQERLLWEREDQEQDKREREKWEKERVEVDNLACLKKLMNTNLTSFRQHLGSWNVSGFDDFVNMSLLMSSIAEMKQSVLASVQEIWVEAEAALNKMGDDVKNGKQPYLDTSVMADYLKQALVILRSQFYDVVNDHTKNFAEEEKVERSKGFSSTKRKNQKDHEANNDKAAKQNSKSETKKDSSIWNKTVGKMFKKTSKSLRKFVRTVSSSWSEMISLWEKKASHFMKSGEAVPEDSQNTISLPSWLQGKTCQHLSNEQNFVVDMGSPCLWDVRNSLMNLVLQEPCDPHNRYSLACNVDANTVWRLKKDIKKILEVDADFRANKITSVDGKSILGLFEEFWRQWENSELLLKSDKDWASCLLKEWSNAVYSSVGWTKATGRDCHRFVNLRTVFMDIDSRTKHPTHQSKKQMGEEAINDEDQSQADVEGEYEDSMTMEETLEANVQYSSRQFNNANSDGTDDDENDEIHVYEDFDDTESENVDYYEESDRFESKEKFSDDEARVTRSNFSDKMTENEHYKQTAWYLKRAQYRLAMRRAQEKASWFFDMSDHRDEMRKEHNVEIKSGQWLFDQADDREAQRQKDHQADWVFERAHHRRQEFARKWSHTNQPHKRRQRGNVNDCHNHDECLTVEGKRKKMKNLSKSDWLLQNNRLGRGKGKGTGKGKRAFKKAKKGNQKLEKNKKGKYEKHQKGRQHNNKRHSQHRSPKK